MASSLLLCITIYIALIDLRFHKIQHFSLAVLALPLLLDLHPLPAFQALLLLLLTLVFTLLCGFGGGDFKLLALLISTQGALISSPLYLQGVLISTLLSLLFALVVHRSLRAEIPMAPALLAPFMAIYLAI